MVRPDYTVQLSRVFQGPLDLLLHLVREQEVDIIEIEISKILDGYLAYIENLEWLDVEYAGDFLVMAATLMAIKSRSLLPAEEVDLDEELDPRDELIQRLVEYRRFKGVADDLEELWKTRENEAERGFFPETGAFTVEREYDLSELTPFDLATTFARLKRETLTDVSHHITADPRPLRFYVERVVDRLRAGHEGSLQVLMKTFDDVPRREALIGSFCALLELAKIQAVELSQEEGSRELDIRLKAENAGKLDDLLEAAIEEVEREEQQAQAESADEEEGNEGNEVDEGLTEAALLDLEEEEEELETFELRPRPAGAPEPTEVPDGPGAPEYGASLESEASEPYADPDPDPDPGPGEPMDGEGPGPEA